jgi:hypothetical protein
MPASADQPRRGRPLLVWGAAIVLLALGLALRWPALAVEEQALAARLAAVNTPVVAPRLAQAAPAQQPTVTVPPAPPQPASPQPTLSAPPSQPLQPVVHPMLPAPPAPVRPPEPLPAMPAPPPAPARVPAPAAPAFALADAAYARLRDGQRRQAAALFDAALALAPGNRQWQADRAALGRHWQLGAYALLRDAPAATANAPGSGLGGVAASPVLGGGQFGASVAFLPDPYAHRPLALVARANVAATARGIDANSAQLALGLRQSLLPGVSLSAERLLPLGPATRGDWTLRLAAGGSAWRLNFYGEAGVLAGGTIYAGAQANARLLRIGPATLSAGSWASLQSGHPDVWRVDVGPSVSAQFRGVRLQADWRQRVGGNAAPGSGPVVTVAAGF